jgi:uncharacterized OsmC-like protein
MNQSPTSIQLSYNYENPLNGAIIYLIQYRGGFMSEKVVIHQKSNYETEFWSLDPEAPDSTELHPVRRIEDLTPYGMLLASLGSCTAVVVNTYARYHKIALDAVDMSVDYQRTFRKDCENCEKISQYEEQINVEISFKGNLTPEQHEKLAKISLQCPIHKMLKHGIEVKSQLMKTKDTAPDKSKS